MAEGGPLAVGMVLVEGLVDDFGDGAAGVVDGAVLLLVDDLEFGVEEAEDGLEEAVGLELGPGVEAAAGHGDLVDGLLQPGVGVEIAAAEGRDHLGEFVGQGEFGRLLGDLVDLGVDGGALVGIGFGDVLFVEAGDAVEQRFLRREVAGADALRALEHEVFEVVGEAGVGLRVLGAAGADDDLGVEAGALVVAREVDGEAVVELEDVDPHGVVVGGLGEDAVTRQGGEQCGDRDEEG